MCAGRLPLFFEHLLQLFAGERHRGEGVGERLHIRRLTVGDIAVGIACAGGCDHQVCPQAARVHDRDLGTEFGCRPQLHIGDEVAESGLTAPVLRERGSWSARHRVLHSAVEVVGDLAYLHLAEHIGHGGCLVDDRLNRRIRHETGDRQDLADE